MTNLNKRDISTSFLVCSSPAPTKWLSMIILINLLYLARHFYSAWSSSSHYENHKCTHLPYCEAWQTHSPILCCVPKHFKGGPPRSDTLLSLHLWNYCLIYYLVNFLFSYLLWNLCNSLQKRPGAGLSLLLPSPLLRRPAYKKCTQQSRKAGHLFKWGSSAGDKPRRDRGQEWAFLRTSKPCSADPSLTSSPPCAPQQSIPILLPRPGNSSWELLQHKGSQELSWHTHTAQNRSAGATALKFWFLCFWIFKAATWVSAHSFSAHIS